MFLVETGESGTPPDTISEETGTSYGVGRSGAAGGVIGPHGLFELLDVSKN